MHRLWYKTGWLYKAVPALLSNKDTHIKDAHYPLQQVQDKKKGCTDLDIKQADRTSWFQHITVQPKELILHAFNNNILQNLLILLEDDRMADNIYGPIIPHLKFQNSVAQNPTCGVC